MRRDAVGLGRSPSRDNCEVRVVADAGMATCWLEASSGRRRLARGAGATVMAKVGCAGLAEVTCRHGGRTQPAHRGSADARGTKMGE